MREVGGLKKKKKKPWITARFLKKVIKCMITF